MTLRLASYNIRKALGTDRRRDPRRTCTVIAALDADAVVLQEADLRLGPRPTALPAAEIAGLTGLVPAELGQSARSLGWHGNAILLRPGIPVTALHRHHLPGLEPRGCVAADLQTAIGPLRVVGAHLGLLRASRRLQLVAILEMLSRLPPMPTVIAGDFNEWSRRTGLGRLTHGAFTVHAPGRSFHSRRPVAALDRIATSEGLRLTQSGVWAAPPAPHASDHLPIWAELAGA
ncbi:endonuclease/exonuclease/phosphatase family protein [Pseudoroseicyclus aestuarii]|uniref:Endonuclease/exonuclease/phosphatase family metal-dependent hydrolase n=1 Tax=Pseudoroseicyclus aestuarii TaxID=1795041 RepID=A0A318T0B1_9RHOB|nr:endonuclease/exonuclease/phosphatase family protein [Pseudoroseicyclus aestuarii]PYE86156.1 endonuclease/exonuclease/phosphatase family metal-dependent hydrolase [Pseudoroseicyclus aestuarii]